jgi:hypothetical protein
MNTFCNSKSHCVGNVATITPRTNQSISHINLHNMIPKLSAPVPVVASDDDDFDSIQSEDVDEKVVWVNNKNLKAEKPKTRSIQ